MASRRISRTPALMSMREQREFLDALKNSPQLVKNVETLLELDLSSMTDQQKIQALDRYYEAGAGAAVLAAAARAINDVNRLAGAARDEEATADKLRRAEQHIADLETEIAQLRDQLRGQTA
jgi:hypothetical protein